MMLTAGSGSTWLRRTVEVYGWRVHAFVLMTTHDHLFVETPEGNRSAGMQHYNGSYTGQMGGKWGHPASQIVRAPKSGPTRT